MSDWNPETTPNFSLQEMCCKCGKCGGQCEMKQSHMSRLQGMRNILGPLRVTSGYRCPQHPEEQKKATPGAHAQGTATDLQTSNSGSRFKYVQAAVKVGMQGIGLYTNFVHVDSGHETMARPALWFKS
ncbi:MAG: DUF882 domain-containing protein [Gammaproteobacteria bacterium]|nr:DUF882 domain-containing protein [Gammaproteobacteria bacterium]